MKHETLATMFHDQVDRLGPRTLFLSRREGSWQPLSWAEAGSIVRAWARGLLAIGLRGAERVAILSENRPEWALADQAILACGAADVPLYTTHGPADIAYILRDASCRFLFVSRNHLERALAGTEQVPSVEKIICLDTLDQTGEKVVSIHELGLRGGAQEDRRLERCLAETRRADLATVIYTSGTTGPPKGVMLAHENILSNCEAIHQHIDIRADDRTLSFLPLSHSFERTAGYYVFLMCGGQIAYAQNTLSIAEDMLEVQPTILLGVPRFFEKFHARVVHAVSRSPALKRVLFAWGSTVGRRVFKMHDRNAAVSAPLGLAHALARALVFRKILERTGGRIRFFVSGGAPLSPEIIEFFSSVGLLLLEGYGLTETSPVIACNQPENRRLGSVGKTLPGVEVKTAGDGEILVRGPNVMQGYLNRPADTAAVIDADGFLHTGDVGEIDADGFLYVRDRIKDLIITSGGKNIAPQNIENRLQLQEMILQACLIGERKPFVTALIVPNPEALRARVDAGAAEPLGDVELLGKPDSRELVLRAVRTANAGLAEYEKVKRFAILSERFSQESGELTPTLKLRRSEIARRRTRLIEHLYDETPEDETSNPDAPPGGHWFVPVDSETG